jgi:hypothetical protein
MHSEKNSIFTGWRHWKILFLQWSTLTGVIQYAEAFHGAKWSKRRPMLVAFLRGDPVKKNWAFDECPQISAIG